MTLTQIVGGYLVALCLSVLALQGLVTLRTKVRMSRARRELNRVALERDDELINWQRNW
jgi:hypothetical protein